MKKANTCFQLVNKLINILIKEKNKDNVTFKVNSFIHRGTKNADSLISVLMPKPTVELSKIPVTHEVKSNLLTVNINNKKFFLMAGIGYDGDIVHKMHPSLKKIKTELQNLI